MKNRKPPFTNSGRADFSRQLYCHSRESGNPEAIAAGTEACPTRNLTESCHVRTHDNTIRLTRDEFVRSLVFRIFLLVIATLFFISLVGCQRGKPTPKPPIHIVPDMDYQPKYEAQEASKFFVDGASNRLPVEGTVAQGRLNEDDPYYKGVRQGTEDRFIDEAPMEFSIQYLERGKERFRIYCSMCHGARGLGDGIIIEKGFIKPPDFHSDDVRNFPDGKIFSTITNGARNMQSYKQQIPVKDRWLIVNYIRHLQQSGPGPAEGAK